MSLNLGTIYRCRNSEGFPVGTRVEFIGGPDDDIFTDGISIEYLDASEVLRDPDQNPLECSPYIQSAKAAAMAGIDPA